MISPLVYIILAALGFTAVIQYLALGTQPFPGNGRPPLIALILGLAVENLYYGVGRFVPDHYDDLSWWWPGVLGFKAVYILALATLNIRLSQR